MSKQSLATKWRPHTFEDVVGQESITTILQKVVESGKPKNAYLFSGNSGCGKTTLARIFANELNNHVGDPIEIDAASNNGVDQVRAIIDSANQRSLVGTYKIFIIDECHAITSAGWQAFLKGIEEPPAYTIFMFCTTEPDKIPVTIKNRLQRYNVKKISPAKIKDRLLYICQQEGFNNYEATCDFISKLSQGCMRDAITILDQCADFATDLSIENTKPILGSISYETMVKLTNFIINANEAKIFAVIETLDAEGKDLKQFSNMYLEFILDLTKYYLFRSIAATNLPDYLETTTDPAININSLINLPEAYSWFIKLSDALLELKSLLKYDNTPKATVEAYLLKVCRTK